MRKEDLVVAMVCLVTAAAVLFDSIPRFFNDQGSMGPGAFPTFVALLIATCSISVVLQWIGGNRNRDAEPFLPSGLGRTRFAGAAGSLVVHRVATDILGFGVASFLLMVYQMHTLGDHRRRTILLISTVFIFVVSYIFREWLYMSLPRGIVGL